MTARIAAICCAGVLALMGVAAGQQAAAPPPQTAPGRAASAQSRAVESAPAKPALAASAAATAAADASTLVLNQHAWQRCYIQFGLDRLSPAQLKSPEVAKLLGPTMQTLKREVKQVHGFMGKKWDDAAEQGGWMGEAYVLYRQGQAWNPGEMGHMNVLTATSPPPAHWAQPDFDDGGWPRLRASVMSGRGGAPARDDLDELGRRAGYFRFAFELADPAKAGSLELSLLYHGGARVFLNGKELARKDLPEGEITAETRGTEYPLEAYVKLHDDGSMASFDGRTAKGYPFFLGDIYGSFDEAPGRTDPKTKLVWKTGRLGAHGQEFDRANWDRIQALRDRTLGPLVLPAAELRKGTNVLAVEIRASDLHPVAGGYTVWRDPFVLSNYWHAAWFHGQLVKLELRSRGGEVPSMLHRPPGVQVWTADIHHRVFSTEFGPSGLGKAALRFVGALNGEFAGQLVVGTDKELKGLKATASELKLADGSATIPALALSLEYLVGHPVTEMVYLANAASGGRGPSHKCTPTEARSFLAAYGTPELQAKAKGLADPQAMEEAIKLTFFDHVGALPPATVPAESCQPIWVTLKVPAGAKPGKYTGILKIQASVAGANGPADHITQVPIEAEVIGWRIPNRPDWQMVTALEQSPYGVAERYKVPLWSDEHFRLMEASFRQLARVGNKWLFIPVLQNTELGNRGDSMLKWTRKQDGALGFDYAVMDRYIDLAVKHWGRPRVISFYVMHGGAAKVEVPVFDEAKGKCEPYDIGKSPTYQQDWQAFGKALYAHMKARGLAEVMYFGYAWDGESDAALPSILATVAPGVQWSSGSHGYSLPPRYTAQSQIYGAAFGANNLKGWKRSDVYLLNPRGGGKVLGLGGTSEPSLFRILPGRALTSGCNGVARIAADYWDGMYFLGCSAYQFLIPGMGLNSWMLWPGQSGAESSQRFEIMREGIAECEARIFVEQALDRGYLEPELARKAQQALDANERELYFIPVSMSNAFAGHFCLWQERMRRLLEVAAEVAAAMGLDANVSAVSATVPARGQRQLTVRLRNWSDQRRQWRAEADQPWLVPKAAAGTLEGWEDLVLTLDGTKLEPLAKARGKLTLIDVAIGKGRPIDVAVNVTGVLDFTPPNSDTARQWWRFEYLPDKGKVPYNVAPGSTLTQELIVLNQSATEIAFKAEPSAAWVKVEPAEGKVGPQSPLSLKVVVAPPDKGHAIHNEAVKISEVGGPAALEVPLAVHVIPPYRKPPLPAGEALPLNEELYKATLKSYGGAHGAACGIGAQELAGIRDKRLAKGPFVRGIRGGTPYEAVFKIEGKGFEAFSAHVGFAELCYGVVGLSNTPPPETTRVYFEIHVDGELRSQSDVVAPADDFRLITVEGLAQAKELRLVVRPVVLPGAPLTGYWLDPTFYRAK